MVALGYGWPVYVRQPRLPHSGGYQRLRAARATPTGPAAPPRPGPGVPRLPRLNVLVGPLLAGIR
eukprot:7383079-Prymnesium_polylepis.1